MRWVFRLVLGVILLSVIAFGTLAVNQQKVSLEFLKWKTPEWDMFWFLLAAFLFGLVIGWLLAAGSMFSLKLAERRERKQKLQAQNELDAIKAETPVAK